MTKKILTDLDATGRTITAGGLSLPSTTSTITLNSSVGASGQVLTSAGSGSTPTWSDPFTFGAIDMVSGYYYSTPVVTRGTSALTNGDVMLTPFIASKTFSITTMYVQTTASVSGSTATLGIYNSDSQGKPNTLLGYGTISLSAPAGTKTLNLSPSITLNRGQLYWLACLGLAASSTSTFRTVTVSSLFGAVWQQSSTSLTAASAPVCYYAGGQSSLPNPWTSTSTNTVSPIVWISG
jgi:hypothetical protein